MNEKEFIDKKKGQVDFAIKVISGNIRGRKLALYGDNDEIKRALKLYGFKDYITVTAVKENVKNGVEYLYDLGNQVDKYYILVPWLSREQEHVSRLEKLGFREYHDFYFVKSSQNLVNAIVSRGIINQNNINIMTSCDANLMKYIPVQLKGICDAMPGRCVRYYILHSKDTSDEIDKIKNLAKAFDNVEIHGVQVPDEKVYEQISIMCNPHGWWPKEVLYDICAHRYLPEDLDRVLYLDAGDVMVTGNIDAFYFADFHDKPIRVTMGRYKEVSKQGKIVPYEAGDLYQGDVDMVQEILMGVFNSGSFMINLKKMREIGYTEDDYIAFIKKIYDLYDNKVIFKYTDQGLLSAFFLGEIQYFGLEEFNDFWYRPFNFCLYYYDTSAEKPYYTPAIVHFAGFHSYKPWLIDFPIILDSYRGGKAQYKISSVNSDMRPYYSIWLSNYVKTQLQIDGHLYIKGLISVKEKGDKKRHKDLLHSYVSVLSREYDIPFESRYDGEFAYVSFPVSDDGEIHYEFCWDNESLKICLHFEGGWKNSEEVIRESMEKCSELKHEILRDCLGIYYIVEDVYDVDLVVGFMEYMMKKTYPVLRKYGLISDRLLLRQLEFHR